MSRSSNQSKRHILSNVWYGRVVDADLRPRVKGGNFRAILFAVGLCWRSRKYRILLTSEGAMRPAGLAVLLLMMRLMRLMRLMGTCELVLVEFLPGQKQGIAGRMVATVYKSSLARVCCAIQVMTDWERAAYARQFAIPLETLRFIPYYHWDNRVLTKDDPQERFGILASGRNSCDWDNLLKAAEGQGWPLTIICSKDDGLKIQQRCSSIGAELITDVSQEDHDLKLSASQLYVLALKENGVSSGHVRLMGCLSHGVPVVATDVLGTTGYSDLATVSVPANDPSSLRAAVNRALEFPEAHLERHRETVRRAKKWSYDDYVLEVASFIKGSATDASIQ